MPWTERIWASRVREICMHGLKRAEAAAHPAPPLLDCVSWSMELLPGNRCGFFAVDPVVAFFNTTARDSLTGALGLCRRDGSCPRASIAPQRFTRWRFGLGIPTLPRRRHAGLSTGPVRRGPPEPARVPTAVGKKVEILLLPPKPFPSNQLGRYSGATSDPGRNNPTICVCF
jgi:hypothetical protein